MLLFKLHVIKQRKKRLSVRNRVRWHDAGLHPLKERLLNCVVLQVILKDVQH